MTAEMPPEPYTEVPADPNLRVLLDRYRETKAEAADAKKRADEAAAELKIALTLAHPGTNKVAVVGHGPAVRLSYVESSRLDTAKLRANLGDLVDQYTKTSGSWQLREDTT
jgi:hypothetical protein